MDNSSDNASGTDVTFDPSTVSVTELIELFPDIGLFSAEDVIGWRDKHAAFPDAEALSTLGIEPDVAAKLTKSAVSSANVADIADVADVAEDEPETVASAVSEPVLRSVPPAPPPPAPSGPPPLPVEVAPVPAEVPPTPEETDEVVAVAAPIAPIAPIAPVVPVVPVAPVAPVSPPRRGRSSTRFIVLGLFVLNALVAASVAYLHREQRRAHAPIAAVSAEVSGLQTEQAATRAQLDETRAKLEATRESLDEQAKVVAATAQRQKDADREAVEREARETRELSALSGRVSGVEKSAYKLKEAVLLIDLVQGRPSVPPAAGSQERPIENP